MEEICLNFPMLIGIELKKFLRVYLLKIQASHSDEILAQPPKPVFVKLFIHTTSILLSTTICMFINGENDVFFTSNSRDNLEAFADVAAYASGNSY